MSEDIIRECVQLQQKLSELPARLARPEGIHLTLIPPWDMKEQGEAVTRIKDVLDDHDPFTLRLHQLEYGPTKQRPRIAWITCLADKRLVDLRNALKEAFVYKDRYAFRPHVTLARFKDEHHSLLKAMPIEEKVDLSMRVQSVELFESLHRGGVAYRVLASVPL